MQLEVGSVYEGRVRGITQYGAFVDITTVSDTGAKQTVTGMVHISEISDTFVRDIRDFLAEQDTVRVKVIAGEQGGRLSLSIRQAQEHSEKEQGKPFKKPRDSAKPRVYEPKRSVPQSEMSFEDKLQHYIQLSEERRCDIKRGSERRNGTRRRK